MSALKSERTESRRHALLRHRAQEDSTNHRRIVESIRFQKCGGGRRIIRKRLAD